MEKPRPSTLMWAGIATSVLVYDVLAPQGDTLSEAVDRGLEGRYKHVVAGAIGVTALHLLNIITPDYDPFHHALKFRDK